MDLAASTNPIQHSSFNIQHNLKFTIAIHGGAGTIVKEHMTAELEQAYLTGMDKSLLAGYSVLQGGGSAVDAVSAAVVELENNILFNAGKGSVFTKTGQHEMDACIMGGEKLEAGAVAGVKNIPNPILLALKVMQESDHVFLSGDGANEFAINKGIRPESDQYFFSGFRYDQWKRMRDSEHFALDHSVEDLMKDKKFGTVGAVALDQAGNLAAATSTGGMTNKRYGRIGDSPIIGAGTYANNRTCAVSCTGHGEPFIKAVAAYDVSCLIEYKGMTLHQACEEVIFKKLPALEGEGGLIAVDPAGNTAMVFNSAGMYRAMRSSEGQREMSIYK